jgi:hypothetical protein
MPQDPTTRLLDDVGWLRTLALQLAELKILAARPANCSVASSTRPARRSTVRASRWA